MKLGTQQFLVNITVLEWIELKTIVICLILRAKFLFYGFLSVFCTFLLKVIQRWFVRHETWLQHYLVYIAVF